MFLRLNIRRACTTAMQPSPDSSPSIALRDSVQATAYAQTRNTATPPTAKTRLNASSASASSANSASSIPAAFGFLYHSRNLSRQCIPYLSFAAATASGVMSGHFVPCGLASSSPEPPRTSISLSPYSIRLRCPRSKRKPSLPPGDWGSVITSARPPSTSPTQGDSPMRLCGSATSRWKTRVTPSGCLMQKCRGSSATKYDSFQLAWLSTSPPNPEMAFAAVDAAAANAIVRNVAAALIRAPL